ncbi:ABC transporter permease [Halarcobacter ebronensis]|uniref:ABC transporter permease n=1 Tax=Halarcobacter ebronensis TaxID=1462615 RepID=UPI00155DB73C|nr:ABC transporter permease [Halarcobacter ebronensis]QKF81545.1 multidrug resistance ABC transporter, permease protein [Halarcobacter ebronensis]
MISSQRLKAIFIKESIQILRDPSALIIALILPLMLLFLMGYAISLDAKHTPIGIVVEKSSKHTQSLIKAFESSESFDIEIANDKRAFIKKLQEGKLRAMVVIPSTFDKDILQGKPTIQIIADGSEPNIAGYVNKYAQELWQNWLSYENISTTKLIDIQTRYWFNAPLSSTYFLLPGSIAVILTLIGTLLTALVVAREWERGTMEAVMSTPTTILELLLGKLLPYFILGMASLIICITITLLWFQIPYRGSYFLLFITSAIYLFPSLSLGLLISTLAKNQFVAAQMALIIGFLPAMILSGFIFQISSMPNWLQFITNFIPATYFTTILQTLFLAGDIYEIIIPNSLFMLLIGFGLFTIIFKITRKKLS